MIRPGLVVFCAFAAGWTAVATACAHNARSNSAPAAASAPASSSASPTAAEGPRVIAGDVRKLYARELAPLPVTKIHAGKLNGEVEGAGPPKIESDEHSTRITFSLGTGSDVRCFVYPRSMDVGAQLFGIVKAIEGVDVQLLRPDVVLIGDRVAVFLEVQYLAKTPEGVAGGELKMMAYDHPTTPLFCMQEEVGYNATFRRVTTEMAASLRLEGTELKIPKFVEIYADSINDQPTGFTRSALLAADKGTFIYIETHVTVVPRSQKDLFVEDSLRTTSVDASGKVAEIRYAGSSGGEQTDNVTLKRIGAHEYSYSGTHRGKKIAGKLKTKDPRGFPTEADTTRDTLKLFADKAPVSELHVEEYHPDMDPTAPVEYVMRATSKADRKVSVTFGQVQLSGSVDAEGRMESAERSMGNATLNIRRVFTRGSL
jgi:hypothetical protein